MLFRSEEAPAFTGEQEVVAPTLLGDSSPSGAKKTDAPIIDPLELPLQAMHEQSPKVKRGVLITEDSPRRTPKRVHFPDEEGEDGAGRSVHPLVTMFEVFSKMSDSIGSDVVDDDDKDYGVRHVMDRNYTTHDQIQAQPWSWSLQCCAAMVETATEGAPPRVPHSVTAMDLGAPPLHF